LSGYAVAAVQAPRYQAAATVFVAPAREPGILANDDLEAGDSARHDLCQPCHQPAVLASAAATLQPPMPVETLREVVSARAVAELPLIEIVGSAQQPDRAAAIANVAATALTERIRADVVERVAPAQTAIGEQIAAARQGIADIEAGPAGVGERERAQVEREIQQRRDALALLEASAATIEQRVAGAVTEATVWAPAVPPLDPVAPRRALLIILGAVAGLMVGVAAVVVRPLLDREFTGHRKASDDGA
jgi:uncharacterized protein involved in exopolysaccharide biosynthesis